jgi:putative tricarboxylic transport membrane protein
MNNRALLRRVAALAAAALMMAAVGPVRADWQPSEDVEFVIPYGLGGGADLLARTLIKIMVEEKLVPVNINAVNKPGGGASVGVAYVAATKRGNPNTLVLINPQTQITPMREPNALGWRALTPLANVMLDDYLIFVRKDSPYGDAADMVKGAKAKDERSISIGSAGTADDMAIAVFEAGTGIKLNTVRFNSGGEILTALLGGHVDLGAGNPLEYMGHLSSGDIRALGVYRPTRFPDLPEVPTLKEQGIQVTPFQMWRGVAMPADAPAEAVEYWSGVMEKVGTSKQFNDYIKANVATTHVLVGNDFEKFLENQEVLYRNMLKRLGVIK